MPVIKPKKLRLYNALRIGYLRTEAKQAKRLKRFGYILDKELTNREHLVAFNPFTNKGLFVSNGTQITSAADILTDIALASGNLKNTPRFKSDSNAYLKAKDKYKDVQFKLVSHSLGGGIVSALDLKGNDRGITYNAANILQKPKKNVTNFRTAGDLISVLARDTRTLGNDASLVGRLNPIQPHNVGNIRYEPIFI
jgi:hypothetical protein